jgi:hypothetical protein
MSEERKDIAEAAENLAEAVEADADADEALAEAIEAEVEANKEIRQEEVKAEVEIAKINADAAVEIAQAQKEQSQWQTSLEGKLTELLQQVMAIDQRLERSLSELATTLSQLAIPPAPPPLPIQEPQILSPSSAEAVPEEVEKEKRVRKYRFHRL